MTPLCQMPLYAVRIAKAREAKGLSQEALAALLKISSGTVSRWERGVMAPRGQNLTKLSRVLENPPAWLVPEEDDGSPAPDRQAAAPVPQRPSASRPTTTSEATFSEINDALEQAEASEDERLEVLDALRGKAGLFGITVDYVRGLLAGIRRAAAGKPTKDASPRETAGRAKAGIDLTEAARERGAAKGHMQLPKPKAGKRPEPMSGARRRTGK